MFRTFLFCLFHSALLAQNGDYSSFAHQADSLFQRSEYLDAARAFSNAFEARGWRGEAPDRYLAARAWARAGGLDSAFFQLNRILEKMDFLDKDDLWTLETDFDALHNDLRWKRLLTQWQLKQERLARTRQNPLSIELEQIYRKDQYFRTKKDSVLSMHGSGSPEALDWSRRTIEQDSQNMARVETILNEHGWLGEEDVTALASKALWIVIQHAPFEKQEYFLPMMRQAVHDGKASGANLAYLEDRILMRQGKNQRYGSQLRRDESGGWILHPVEDPEHLNERRKSVGLGPIEAYLKDTGAKWKQ